MLFRTVYGHELEIVWQVICDTADGMSKSQIIEAFVPSPGSESTKGISPQNIEDALTFLVSAHIVDEQDGIFTATAPRVPFKLFLLRHLRQLEQGTLLPRHDADPFFMAILTNVFMLPDVLFVENLHARANSIEGVKELGGISKEKVQAWKRVMEYIGLGFRVQNGFLCTISHTLLNAILSTIPRETETLQNVFEQYFPYYMPCLNRSSDVARPIRLSLLQLEQSGRISLRPLQDSPSKAYFHPEQLRQLIRTSANA